MISFSAVLYLMVRALPRIAEAPDMEKRSVLDRWAHSQIPERVDLFLNSFLLKLLRKIRVLVLRLDNSLSRSLQKVKPGDEANDKRPNIDFKEIAGQNKGEEPLQ